MPVSMICRTTRSWIQKPPEQGVFLWTMVSTANPRNPREYGYTRQDYTWCFLVPLIPLEGGKNSVLSRGVKSPLAYRVLFRGPICLAHEIRGPRVDLSWGALTYRGVCWHKKCLATFGDKGTKPTLYSIATINKSKYETTKNNPNAFVSITLFKMYHPKPKFR